MQTPVIFLGLLDDLLKLVVHLLGERIRVRKYDLLEVVL